MKPEDENNKPGQDPQQPSGESPQDDAAMQQALQALRQLPPVEAPDIVRARAKHAFMRGRAGKRSDESVGVVARPSSAPPPTATTASATDDKTSAGGPHDRAVDDDRIVSLNPRRPNRFMPLAFAAAIVLMFFGYGAQAPHPWRLTAVSDPDGDLAGNTDRSVGSILTAGELHTPEHGSFELTLGSSLRLRMAPCSGIVLPDAPRRWNPETMTIAVEHGELFGSTGGEKLPAAINLVTNVLSARITGTTFAVFRIPEATCVCLLEGSVQITPSVGNATPIDVPVESKVLIFNDGRPHEIVPIDGMERSKLQMLLDRAKQR